MQARPHSRLAVAALLGLAACGDAAGPGTPPPADLGLVLSATFETPTHATDTDGTPYLDCTVHFIVRAEGPPTERAVWTGMVLRYFAGADRSAPVDSAVLSGADVSLALGGPKLDGGEDQRNSWRIVSPLPFVAELELRYEHRGTVRTAATRTPCGAQSDATSAAPASPAVTLQHAEALEPGGRLTVSWTASAEAGIWETGVIVPTTGERIRFPEEGRPTTSRSTDVAVPRITGISFDLQVYTRDVLGRVTTTAVETPVVLDRTPPSVLAARAGSGIGPQGLDGQFAAGDTLGLYLYATDDDRVEYLRFGRGIPEDSVPLRESPVDRTLSLPIPPSWAGSTGFSLQARDRAGNAGSIIRSEATRFYPVRAPARREVTLASGPRQVILDEPHGRLWVRSADAELRAFALDDLTSADRLALHGTPVDMDVTVGGDTLVVALAGHLSRFSLRDPARVETVPLENVATVLAMRMSAGGEAIILGTLHVGGLGLFAADPATGRTRLLRRDPPITGGLVLTRSGDARRFLLGHGCPYEPAADSFGPCGFVGWDAVASDGSGSAWASAGYVVDASLEPVLQVTEARAEGGVWLTADGSEAFFATDRGPLRVRVSDGRYIEGYRGFAGGDGLAVTSDGSVLLVWDAESGRIARMTLR